MAEMNNVQVALMAAATSMSGAGRIYEAAVTERAEKFLAWLDERDAERPPWPVRLASPEVAARYADVGDDDEGPGDQDRGLPR